MTIAPRTDFDHRPFVDRATSSPRPAATSRPLVGALLLALGCSRGNDRDSDGAMLAETESGPTSGTGDPTAATDADATADDATGEMACVVDDTQIYAYGETDEQGRWVIDTLFVLTDDAVAEIADMGMTPEAFTRFRIDALNETIERSQITTSRVRWAGVHVLSEADYQRVGQWPGGPLQDVGNALPWLSTYRRVYGADTLAMIGSAGLAENGVSVTNGEISAFGTVEIPLEHQMGYTMGGGGCHQMDSTGAGFGLPLTGYDANGNVVNPGAPEGGTRMCGNTVALYSNPDITLTVAQLEDLAAQGLAPGIDYAAILGPGGSMTMGHPQFANMAQTWRDHEQQVSARVTTTIYPNEEPIPYDKDDCVGFFEGEGYQCLVAEVCVGDMITGDAEISAARSLQVGRDVHVSLFAAPDFGEGTTFGGPRLRLANSVPSIAALAEHHEVDPIADGFASVAVYAADDRDTHTLGGGDFEYFGRSLQPFVHSDGAGERLQMLPDRTYFTSSVAIRKTPVELPFAVEFEFSSYTVEAEHADGMVVMIGKNPNAYDAELPPSGSLGFIADGTGFGVRFSTWPTGTISVVDGSYADVGLPVDNELTYTDGAFVPVRIEVTSTNVVVFYDGVQQLDVPVATATPQATLELGVGNGAYTSGYDIRGFSITPL